MYSSYTAEQLARTYELADRHHASLIGAVTWAFEFEGQPSFAGFRDLATNGVDKPVLNIFRMFGLMKGDRVSVDSSGSLPLDEVRDKSVTAQPDVGALATADTRSASVLVWNYHDDDVKGTPADVVLNVAGITSATATLTHYRVDQDHSNAYTAWLRMGSPGIPDDAQRATLVSAGQLQTLDTPSPIAVANGTAQLRISLPRQGVSLVRLTW